MGYERIQQFTYHAGTSYAWDYGIVTPFLLAPSGVVYAPSHMM